MASRRETGGVLAEDGSPVSGSAIRLPVAKVAHSTHGRVRLKFAGQSTASLQAVGERLRGMNHVRGVEVNPRTGSIIVNHTAKHALMATQLADLGRDSGLFFLEAMEDPAQASAHLTDVEHDAAYLVDHSKTGKVIVRYAEHLNRVVKTATNGWLDLRIMLPATAGFCALLFVEIESAPLWVPLALFSFQSFNNLHQPHPTNAAAAREQMTLESGTGMRGSEPESVSTEVAQPPARRTTRRRDVGAPERTS